MVPHIFVMYHVILTQVFQVPECFTNAFERELKWTFIFRDVVFHREVASIRHSLWRRANARNVSFELFTVANSCYQLSWWITFSCHTLPSTQHYIFLRNLIPLFNRKTDVTRNTIVSQGNLFKSYWSVSCSKRLSFRIFAAVYTASDNHRSVSFWPTFPSTTHYSFSKLLTNNLVHKLSQISSLLSKRQLVTEKYIHRSQSWVTTRKKHRTENNDNEASVFTSIDLRASKTIIYLNTEWVIGLSVEKKENKRSGLFERPISGFCKFSKIWWTIPS